VDRSCETPQLLFLEHYLLGRRDLRREILSSIERFPISPVVARLPVPGQVVCHAKHPAADVFLVSTRRQMALQAQKCVLHHILRFVARESETRKVAQQGFA
jgi:hypothetical protein